jgi:hypothetical protein
MEAPWTIDQLTEVVRLALETAGYNGQDSKRVRDLPDKRTIRYYTTLGILDRPMEFRGRTAYYGLRHLLQLVAIKRLQARGASLVEVQRSLAGADPQTLVRLAALPEGLEAKLADATLPGAGPPISRPAPAARGAFWAAEPRTPSPDEAAGSGESERSYRPRAAVVLALSPGVRLVIDDLDPGELTPAKLRGLLPVLEALSLALRQAGLVPADAARRENSPNLTSESED